MIMVKIEMWPGGDEKRKYDLAAIAIRNTGEGNAQVATYEYMVSHQIDSERGKYWRGFKEFSQEFFVGSANTWKRGVVEDFLRRDGAVKLLASVLRRAKL